MKIIAGKLKGRKLIPIQAINLRPTLGKIRESIFSILSRRIECSNVLDLFAGTGSLGIEAISRGAKKAVFVDVRKRVVSNIKNNLNVLGIGHTSTVLQLDVLKNLNSIKKLNSYFDIIFIDPPYNQNMIKQTLVNLNNTNILNSKAYIIVEHSSREIIPHLSKLILLDQRKYKNSTISFLSNVKI